jgi:hypothetical protein
VAKYEVTRANGTVLTVDAEDEDQARRLGSDGGHGILSVAALDDDSDVVRDEDFPAEGYAQPQHYVGEEGETTEGQGREFFQPPSAPVVPPSSDVVNEPQRPEEGESSANPG